MVKLVHRREDGTLVSAWTGAMMDAWFLKDRKDLPALAWPLWSVTGQYPHAELKKLMLNRLVREYRPGKWTFATKVMISCGYGLCVFEDLCQAEEFAYGEGLRFSGSSHPAEAVEAWEVECRGWMPAAYWQMPIIHLIFTAKGFGSTISNNFPRGTKMFERVKLVRRLR